MQKSPPGEERLYGSAKLQHLRDVDEVGLTVDPDSMVDTEYIFISPIVISEIQDAMELSTDATFRCTASASLYFNIFVHSCVYRN